jgi:hypothetical protein
MAGALLASRARVEDDADAIMPPPLPLPRQAL